MPLGHPEFATRSLSCADSGHRWTPTALALGFTSTSRGLAAAAEDATLLLSGQVPGSPLLRLEVDCARAQTAWPSRIFGCYERMFGSQTPASAIFGRTE